MKNTIWIGLTLYKLKTILSKYKIAFLSYRSDPLSGGQGIYV